jgi:cell shape-determining protein MreC
VTPRTRNLVLAGSLAAVALGLAASGVGAWLWGRAGGWLAPVKRGLAGGETAGEDLAALREQVVRLNAENVLLRTRLGEYAAIRGEGGVPPEQAVVVRARIVARTLREGRRYCEIDAGAVDGVNKGMAACLGWTLTGLVAGVQEGRALVQLVSDGESRIAAALIDGDKVVAEGVLRGTGHRAKLTLDYVEDREGLAIVPGMRVVTAGSDGRLPAGLVLGLVVSAVRSSTADHWHVEVAPLREAESADSLLILRFADAPAR